MIELNLLQGTPEWKAARLKRFCASEAPAMMGESKHEKRTDLLKYKATGIEKEVDARTQELFDKGHAAEALARPIVENIIDRELFPTVGFIKLEEMELLASFDGLTDDGSINFEHKAANIELFKEIEANELTPHYYWQIEHQMLVSGADTTVFVSSDGTEENMKHCWYESVPERRKKLIAGWKQFARDLAEYAPEAAPATPVIVEAIQDLPAVTIQVKGELTLSNLSDVTPMFDKFIAEAKTDLKTDEDFAIAEAQAKVGRETAKRCKLTAKSVVDQISTVSEAVRMLEMYAEKFDKLALSQEKLVKEKKENIKLEILTEANKALRQYVEKLNTALAGNYMPEIRADFAGAMKSKKTVSSLREAVSTLLSQCKSSATEIAEQITVNLAATKDDGNDFMFLFPDFRMVCTKDTEDFANLLSARVTTHKAAIKEAADKAAAELIAKANREAEAKANQEAAAVVAEALRKANEAKATERAELAAAEPAKLPEAQPTLNLAAGRSVEIKSDLIRPAATPALSTREKINIILNQMNDSLLAEVLEFCQSATEQEAA